MSSKEDSVVAKELQGLCVEVAKDPSEEKLNKALNYIVERVLAHSEEPRSEAEEEKILSTLELGFRASKELVRHCAFEVFRLVLHRYDDAQIISHENTLSSLLNIMGEHSSPRELYAMVMEPLTTPLKPHTVKLLLLLLQKALGQITKKRFNFFATAFPTILVKTSCLIPQVPGNVAMNPSQLQKLEQDKLVSDRNFQLYLDTLVGFIRSFTPVFQNKSEKEIQADQELKREQKWILSFCFILLAKIYSNELLIEKSEAQLNEIIATIANCKASLMYILGYEERYNGWMNYKKRMVEEQSLEEEEEENDDVINFIQWDFDGIGIFMYLLIVKHVQLPRFPLAISSNVFLFKLCKPYIEKLLQSGIPSLTLAGKKLAKVMLKSFPAYAIQLSPEKKFVKADEKTEIEQYFLFVQAFINFMAGCPKDAERTDALNILNEYISKFHDDGRFALLSSTISTCPYPPLLGLMIHRLKEEIRLEYDSFLTQINRKLNPESPYKPLQPSEVTKQQEQTASTTTSSSQEASSSSSQVSSKYNFIRAPPPVVKMDKETIRQLRIVGKSSHFLTNKSLGLLIEALPKYVTDLTVDSADVLLHGLNLYYFLLLRDNEADLTGIMDTKSREQFDEKILKPLKIKIKELIEKVTAEHEQEKQELEKRESGNTEEAEDEDEEDMQYLINLPEEEIEKMNEEQLDELLRKYDEEERRKNLLEEMRKAFGEHEVERNTLMLRYTMIEEVLQRIDTCLDFKAPHKQE